MNSILRVSVELGRKGQGVDITSRAVDLSYCDSELVAPQDHLVQACNAFPCPSVSWTYEWKSCSKGCGGGYQGMLLKCMLDGVYQVEGDKCVKASASLPPAPRSRVRESISRHTLIVVHYLNYRRISFTY
jgi:hypothetical protein